MGVFIIILAALCCMSCGILDRSGADKKEITYEPVGGVANGNAYALPAGISLACEHRWTIRILQYHPRPIVPRRMYYNSCAVETNQPCMYVSMTIEQDSITSGAIIQAKVNPVSGKLEPTGVDRHFPECKEMLGIAASGDCGIIAALCRRPNRSSENSVYTKDVLATHSAEDWMTRPTNEHLVDDPDKVKHMDEMWLYEWTTGNIEDDPDLYVVHKAIGSWEYGNFHLVFGENDNSYGIAIKTMVFDPGGGPHEADAFLIFDRSDTTMPNRAWSWACGTGHTIFNHPGYHPDLKKYAMLCETDYNEDQTAGEGAVYMRLEDGPAKEFHRVNKDGLNQKGGPNALWPLTGGGFIGVLAAPTALGSGAFWEPPVTAVGVAVFNESGDLQGNINWVVQEPRTWLSYPQLAPLGNGRFLLGYAVMAHLDSLEGEGCHDPCRVPEAYYVMEVDESGNQVTDAVKLEGTGWGEQDHLVPLGDNTVGWAYISNPQRNPDGSLPPCNAGELQLSVYTSVQ